MDKSEKQNDFSVQNSSSETEQTFSTPEFTAPTNIETTPKDKPATELPPTQQSDRAFSIPDANTSSKSTGETPKAIGAESFITPAGGGAKKGGFGKFVIIGILITAIIYGIVFYLYLQNKKIKTDTTENQNTQNTPTIVESTPTPAFSPEFVKVINGNIIYDNPPSEQRVLVDKKDFTTTGITGFVKVAVSPDASKLCFESWPPAPKPALYMSNSDGSNTKEIGLNRRRCIFTADSKKLLYENVGQNAFDILSYDIQTETETNLTPESQDTEFTKVFSLVGLSADGSKLICDYKDTEGERQGQCEIDFNTGEVIYK